MPLLDALPEGGAVALTDYPSTITQITLTSPGGDQVGAGLAPTFTALDADDQTDLAAPLAFTVPAGAQVAGYTVWTSSGPDDSAPLQQTVTFAGSGQYVLTSAPLSIAPRIQWRVGSGEHLEYAFVGPVQYDYRPFQFVPPTRLVNVIPYGQTVWLDSTGAWQQKYAPTLADLAGAQVVYAGGRTYFLSDSQRTDLVAAGFGANIALTERP